MQERVYRVSTKRVVGLAAAPLLLGLMVWPLRSEPAFASFMVVAVALALVWVVWATGLEYQTTTSQIRRVSRFGSCTLQWEELVELRYRGEKRSVNLLPLGTYVTLWLRDARGERMTISGGGNVFGYLVSCPTGVARLQDEVLQQSRDPLLRRLRSRFDAGEEIALGPVSVSRTGGVGIKTFRGIRQIPLQDLAGVGVHEGRVYLYRRNARESEKAVRIASVPNCFALLGLLEGLGAKRVHMQAGFWRPRAT